MASVRQLSQALESYRGTIIIASHDVPFLGSAGTTAGSASTVTSA
jgi:ATPase subunit of ABC transporter with duplicated ATPase domains